MSVLYWQVECRAVAAQQGLLHQRLCDWKAIITHWQSTQSVQPTDWPYWQRLLDASQSQGFDASGQIHADQGIGPCLWLLALKKTAVAGVEVGIVTDATTEVSVDLHREAVVLQQFGTDLAQIRPLAESLGLLLPKLDLVTAMEETDSYWF
ncbi:MULTISPECIES: hypothetical protein [Methylomonas]|uniref:Uncharacterized protein n=1 Tax=Methylomonas koyamae TaxID=702114 RepID=A0A177N436_9GAMM|nr:hypothetical protein [Methylomonas koyamae]OAI12758.1 hypothetical protein A1355_14045 [Methylomonas koyamae]